MVIVAQFLNALVWVKKVFAFCLQWFSIQIGGDDIYHIYHKWEGWYISRRHRDEARGGTWWWQDNRSDGASSVLSLSPVRSITQITLITHHSRAGLIWSLTMFWQNTAQKQPVGASINIACYPEEEEDRTNKHDWQKDDIDPNHQQSATTEEPI